MFSRDIFFHLASLAVTEAQTLSGVSRPVSINTSQFYDTLHSLQQHDTQKYTILAKSSAESKCFASNKPSQELQLQTI